MNSHLNELVLPRLSERPADAHKGDFGLALIIGGSRGMSGAVVLAGKAALRGGAGLVRLAVPDVVLDTVAGFEPSYMTVGLPSDTVGRIAGDAYEAIIELAGPATVVGLGPGLGRSSDLDRLVGRLYQELATPMVIDADALNALATQPDVLSQGGRPRILTPHPGEFARLIGKKLDGEQRESAAADLAARCGVVVVLKGHQTLITDGTRQAKNDTGNPGMATGGCGDVLTGLIAALGCQGLGPFDAARLGVHLHGLAGDFAAAELGEVSMIASDLVQFLPDAFEEFRTWDQDSESR
ncbi:MAG: NAD(P)H-hydrate dehydratase [Planctomycetes bacterium RBG_13_63_9]|nr:MAG: NAD(P)H-hydrate dehydratase [Planctomycetes bacterium RBG_13_63_9]